jgi:hypothetical protein
MKNGSLQRREVIDAADTAQNFRDFDQVVDIRTRLVSFAPLVSVFPGCKLQGLQDRPDRTHFWLHDLLPPHGSIIRPIATRP